MGIRQTKKEKNKSDSNNQEMILPSNINREYLEKKFKEKNHGKQNDDASQTDMKIIIDKKKLTIFNCATSQKIYESEDFIQVIRNLSNLKIPEDLDFKIELLRILKNRLFIIIANGLSHYGTYFIFKFDETKNDIEMIEEKKDRSIFFIAQFANGNFAYNSFIHRPIYTEDSLFYYDIEKKEKHFIATFGEYDSVCYDFSNIAILENGFAFINHLIVNENNQSRDLKITDGINIESFNIDFTDDIKNLMLDNKYIYLLNRENKVFIFDIERKKFYPNFIKI